MLNYKYNVTGNIAKNMADLLNLSKSHSVFDLTSTEYGTLIAKVNKSFHDNSTDEIYVECFWNGAFVTAVKGGKVIRKDIINIMDESAPHAELKYLLYTMGVYRGTFGADDEFEDSDDLLSLSALEWLQSVDYKSKSHEDRMVLIRAAKIAYSK